LSFDSQPQGAPEDHQVTITLNGVGLGDVLITTGRSQGRLQLPAGILTSVNEIELGFVPAVEMGPSGRAPLALTSIGVLGSTRTRKGGSSTVAHLNPELRGLVLAGSGVFVLPLDIPANAVEMFLETRRVGEGLARVSVSALDGRGDRTSLGSVHLNGDSWIPLAFSLQELAGERVVLAVEIEQPGQTEKIEIRDLRIEVAEGDTAVKPAATDPSRDQPYPDVIVIILDAARGDRFPGWGYRRQTTPSLDVVAESALAFRHAYAECPTTSCSIPALITGVSFLGGGAVGTGQQVSDDITTLAEYLQLHGYHTVGMSATPNNSASRNHDQGFDDFRELWGRDNPNHGALSMSRLAAEVIQSQPPEQPLFLQLHYLPPHQPYEPGPDFDRFSDPGYDGPIWPRMSLKPFNLGAEILEGEDLDYLIDLYDGNLLRADAAVDLVFEALRSAGRYDDSLIVVTSDHGEAFMEHGRQGHNTTLFDEMLHVPLIVRLPGGALPTGVDTGRLASLLDLVPTLLGYLDIPTVAEVDGIDLLTRVPDPQRPRVLFARTSHPDAPMLAARTPYWKAIAWPRREVQMLFDLQADPAEQDNLVGERPIMFAGLGLLTRRHLLETRGRGLEGAPVELTPEAEEALRALGYLD
jgi:arylsulfatase